ncbi:Juvenile hormone acid O-methyltransferase like protein [Argiope bruennichi]|uniref:Juvenile hormone acid O-methyltransferase like protein n=1 Tax=Argiope bruennichi TaxID=94029 RepID=A0A8T0ES94_ARGBR|nr:Juvenile hormone acid O-methyltransferase like protein [Argiope bruennichi]
MDSKPNLHQVACRKFIDHCKDTFGWSDLTDDVIMDVGCGEEGLCGKSMLEKFPDVSAIIGIDFDPKVVRNFKLKTTPKFQCVLADIEKRETLRNYKGKINKIISIRTFHQLINKEEAFRNVYHLLKPGGEAAILFGSYTVDMYKSGENKDRFKEMVEKIGFRVLECSEAKIVIPYPSDQACKDALYQMCGNSFNIPPEEVEQFKEECFQLLVKTSARDPEGRPCYRSTELRLLLAKPTESSGTPGAEHLGLQTTI